MSLLFYLLLGLPTIPKDYKLQIGDEVAIYVSGKVSFNYDEAISPQGTIFLYSEEFSVYTDSIIRGIVLEAVKIHNLTVDSAKKVVQEKFNKYFKNTTISFVVKQFRDVVYVSGAVAMPGAYPFFPGQTAMYYIGKAGGLGERADVQNMYVISAKGGSRKESGKTNKTKIPLDEVGEVDRYDTIVVEYIPLNVWKDYIGIVSTFVDIIVAWVALTK